MKREILFRGKRKLDKKWVYGFYYEYNNRSIICSELHSGDGDFYYNDEVIPETIGQFTGLTDKNGVKIFENDIFILGDKRIKYKVIYSNGSFLGNQLGNKSTVGVNNYWQNSIEIIGNIHA